MISAASQPSMWLREELCVFGTWAEMLSHCQGKFWRPTDHQEGSKYCVYSEHNRDCRILWVYLFCKLWEVIHKELDIIQSLNSQVLVGQWNHSSYSGLWRSGVYGQKAGTNSGQGANPSHSTPCFTHHWPPQLISACLWGKPHDIIARTCKLCQGGESSPGRSGVRQQCYPLHHHASPGSIIFCCRSYLRLCSLMF